MDATKTMEALNASADAANEAAETALLASEGIIALSSKVSDDVRDAVQQAIESATPSSTAGAAAPLDTSALVTEMESVVQLAMAAAPPATATFDTAPLVEELTAAMQEAVKSATPKPSVMDAVLNPEEEEDKKSPLDHAPLAAAALTLCGVGYLAMQNIELSSDLVDQHQKLTAIEEQLQVNVAESGNQVMLLAEQGQRIEESIKTLSTPPTDESQTTEKSVEMVALEQVASQLTALQQTLEQIQTTSAAHQEASAAEHAAAVTPEAGSSAITLDGIRTTLQEELSPLHLTLKGVEQRMNEKPAVSIPLQPLPTAAPAAAEEQPPRQEGQRVIRYDNSKPKVCRFP